MNAKDIALVFLVTCDGLHFPASRAAVGPLRGCGGVQALSLCEDLAMHELCSGRDGGPEMSLLEIQKWSQGAIPKLLVLLMPHFRINAIKIYVKGLPQCCWNYPPKFPLRRWQGMLRFSALTLVLGE